MALVTGASGGLGPAIAAAFVERGFRVAVTDLPSTGPEGVAERLRHEGGEALAHPADLTSQEDREALRCAVRDRFGRVQVLVNNAGVERMLAFHKHTDDELEWMVSVNLLAPLQLTRALLPDMLARREGHVVNMASLAAKAGAPYTAPYAATKAGVVALTRALRAEYRHRGVSASAVIPGFVRDVGMFHRAQRASGSGTPRLLGTVTPEEVARAVVRSVERDIPEVILNPGPMRLLSGLGEVFPDLGRRLGRWLGGDEALARWAELNESARDALERPGARSLPANAAEGVDDRTG